MVVGREARRAGQRSIKNVSKAAPASVEQGSFRTKENDCGNVCHGGHLTGASVVCDEQIRSLKNAQEVPNGSSIPSKIDAQSVVFAGA